MPKYLLSEKERELALQLADNILNDDDCLSIICKEFSKDPFAADAIMDFWGKYNQKTKSVLNKVIAYRCRKHLTRCLELECKGHPDYEN